MYFSFHSWSQVKVLYQNLPYNHKLNIFPVVIPEYPAMIFLMHDPQRISYSLIAMIFIFDISRA